MGTYRCVKDGNPKKNWCYTKPKRDNGLQSWYLGKSALPRGVSNPAGTRCTVVVLLTLSIARTTTIRPKMIFRFPSIGFQNGLKPVRGEIDDIYFSRQKQKEKKSKLMVRSYGSRTQVRF